MEGRLTDIIMQGSEAMDTDVLFFFNQRREVLDTSYIEVSGSSGKKESNGEKEEMLNEMFRGEMLNISEREKDRREGIH